mgnify:CR=1 FL=1
MGTVARRTAMTIRFTETQRDILRDEAQRHGMTFTDFVRSAALAVALYERGKRGDADAEAILELIERLRED